MKLLSIARVACLIFIRHDSDLLCALTSNVCLQSLPLFFRLSNAAVEY
jgi:hypothetical protein